MMVSCLPKNKVTSSVAVPLILLVLTTSILLFRTKMHEFPGAVLDDASKKEQANINNNHPKTSRSHLSTFTIWCALLYRIPQEAVPPCVLDFAIHFSHLLAGEVGTHLLALEWIDDLFIPGGCILGRHVVYIYNII